MVGASARPQSNRRWRGHAIPFTVLFAGYRRGLTRASMMRLFDCKKNISHQISSISKFKKYNLFFFLKTSLYPFHCEQILRSVRYSERAVIYYVHFDCSIFKTECDVQIFRHEIAIPGYCTCCIFMNFCFQRAKRLICNYATAMQSVR